MHHAVVAQLVKRQGESTTEGLTKAFCHFAECLAELIPWKDMDLHEYPRLTDEDAWRREYTYNHFPDIEVKPGSTQEGVRAVQVISESMAILGSTERTDLRDLVGAVVDDSVANTMHDDDSMPTMDRSEIIREVTTALVDDTVQREYVEPPVDFRESSDWARDEDWEQLSPEDPDNDGSRPWSRDEQWQHHGQTSQPTRRSDDKGQGKGKSKGRGPGKGSGRGQGPWQSSSWRTSAWTAGAAFGSSWWQSQGETTGDDIVLRAGGLPMDFFEATPYEYLTEAIESSLLPIRLRQDGLPPVVRPVLTPAVERVGFDMEWWLDALYAIMAIATLLVWATVTIVTLFVIIRRRLSKTQHTGQGRLWKARVKFVTWAANVAKIEISFPGGRPALPTEVELVATVTTEEVQAAPLPDLKTWWSINHTMELADEIHPSGTGKYMKRFAMIFVARDGPTISHITRGCQVITERERRSMLGVLIDRALVHSLDLCGECRRHLDSGRHRLRSVKPKCFALSKITAAGDVEMEKFIAMGYVPSSTSDEAGRVANHRLGHFRDGDRHFWRQTVELVEAAEEYASIHDGTPIEEMLIFLRGIPSVRGHMTTTDAAWHTERVLRDLDCWGTDPSFNADREAEYIIQCIDTVRDMLSRPRNWGMRRPTWNTPRVSPNRQDATPEVTTIDNASERPALPTAVELGVHNVVNYAEMLAAEAGVHVSPPIPWPGHPMYQPPREHAVYEAPEYCPFYRVGNDGTTVDLTQQCSYRCWYGSYSHHGCGRRCARPSNHYGRCDCNLHAPPDVVSADWCVPVNVETEERYQLGWRGPEGNINFPN